MAIVRNSNIEILVAPSTPFGAKVQTREIKMDNHQAAHIVVTTGEGAVAKVTAQVYGKKTGKDKESVLLQERELAIGGNSENQFVVVARELAHDELDSIYLVIPNANAGSITGTIFAVKTNERYAEG